MSDATGNPRFREIAVRHADTTLKNHFREDGSSYHVVDYNPADGDIRMKVTAQGYADDSFWSRGQAWAIYGFTACYRFTNDDRYLNHAIKVADWWLDLENMPSDLIPFWDMKAPGTDVPDNPAVPRDASAAAITASALYELATYVDETRANRYLAYANKALDNLAANYSLAPDAAQGFILDHSTGHHPGNSEIDVPLIYADYFYLEAMTIARHALEALNIDQHGLDEIDNRILTTIIDKFKGGPVGLTTIGTAIGEDAGTIEEVYEPFLIKEGFLKRTPRGREVTELAYRHLGRTGARQESLFD